MTQYSNTHIGACVRIKSVSYPAEASVRNTSWKVNVHSGNPLSQYFLIWYFSLSFLSLISEVTVCIIFRPRPTKAYHVSKLTDVSGVRLRDLQAETRWGRLPDLRRSTQSIAKFYGFYLLLKAISEKLLPSFPFWSEQPKSAIFHPSSS